MSLATHVEALLFLAPEPVTVEELADALQSGEHAVEQALKELEAAKIPAGPLYTPQQALDDAHIRQAKLLVDTEYPAAPRPVPLAPTPVDLSETPGTFRHRAPTLGEHTDAILAELGYGVADIKALREKGVV